MSQPSIYSSNLLQILIDIMIKVVQCSLFIMHGILFVRIAYIDVDLTTRLCPNYYYLMPPPFLIMTKWANN